MEAVSSTVLFTKSSLLGSMSAQLFYQSTDQGCDPAKWILHCLKWISLHFQGERNSKGRRKCSLAVEISYSDFGKDLTKSSYTQYGLQGSMGFASVLKHS